MQGSASVSFGYDADSRRVSLGLPNGLTATYSYDAASQLLGIVYQGGALGVANLAYSYDLDGRRIGASGSLANEILPTAVSSATYNADNQLTQWGSTTMTYDLNGNSVNDGTNTYAWDVRNRLASANSGGAAFSYDPLGRRISKTLLSTTTNFLYDGPNPIEELSGSTVTANLLTGGVDERFQRTDTTGSYSYLTDALGSTEALTSSTGAMQASYAYSPYGALSISGSTTNSYDYTGRESDGLGLHYYRARYYNPETGRFLSEDPSGFRGGINEYVYAHGDPIDREDPSGRYDWWWHAYITYQADLAMGYTPEQAWNSAQAVANVDFEPGSQGKDSNSTHKHSMAGRKPNGKPETCQQAYAGTQQQIADDAANGRADEAMHALQDATAPGHRGYQLWNGMPPSFSHMVGDADPPEEDIDQAIQNTEQFLAEYWNNPDSVNPSDFLPQNPCN